MRIYYYAFTGHKWGLDSVKRAAALIGAMETKGIGIELLVNDFRAGLAAREFGIADAVTIESYKDIDAVAERGDIVFIDTPEDISERLERYSDEFGQLFIVSDRERERIYTERYLTPADQMFPSILVADEYFEPLEKEKRVVFFQGDADYDKVILKHAEFFEGSGMELILGHYFFLRYEDELAPLFTTMHEAEEYTQLIRSSSDVVTASVQCALEAGASQANVLYIMSGNDSAEMLEMLGEYDIKIIDGYNRNGLQKFINSDPVIHKNLTNHMERLVTSLFEAINS